MLMALSSDFLSQQYIDVQTARVLRLLCGSVVRYCTEIDYFISRTGVYDVGYSSHPSHLHCTAILLHQTQSRVGESEFKMYVCYRITWKIYVAQNRCETFNKLSQSCPVEMCGCQKVLNWGLLKLCSFVGVVDCLPYLSFSPCPPEGSASRVSTCGCSGEVATIVVDSELRQHMFMNERLHNEGKNCFHTLYQ